MSSALRESKGDQGKPSTPSRRRGNGTVVAGGNSASTGGRGRLNRNATKVGPGSIGKGPRIYDSTIREYRELLKEVSGTPGRWNNMPPELHSKVDTARENFEKAAEHGSDEAHYILGIIYRDGHGVPRDMHRALEGFKTAASLGNRDALFNMGTMYRDGVGMAQDFVKATEYFQMSANKGDAAAINALGMMYMTGRGVHVDCKRAKEFFEQAEKKGDVGALYNLGWLYSQGHGVKRNVAQCRKLWNHAAAQGNADAARAIRMWNLSGPPPVGPDPLVGKPVRLRRIPGLSGSVGTVVHESTSGRFLVKVPKFGQHSIDRDHLKSLAYRDSTLTVVKRKNIGLSTHRQPSIAGVGDKKH